jgi:hypothetical protein
MGRGLLSGWRTWPRLLGLVPGLLAIVCATPRAHGLEVGVEAQGCADLSEPRLRELAALELTTRVVAPRAPRPPGARVLVSCSGERVAIRVTDSMTGKMVMRSFTLKADAPEVRVRAIALAVAELVLTSWLELMLPQPNRSEAATSVRALEERREARAIVQKLTSRGAYVDGVFAFAELGGTLRAAPWTGGVGLRLSVVFAEPALTLDADLSATLSASRTELGSVRTNTWSLAVRPALRLQRGPWLGTAGMGVRAGLARIDGRPAELGASRGRSLVGSWGGPLVHANLGLNLDHFATRLGGEVGYALRGVAGSVEGRERAGVRGAWVMLSLGVGWGA